MKVNEINFIIKTIIVFTVVLFMTSCNFKSVDNNGICNTEVSIGKDIYLSICKECHQVKGGTLMSLEDFKEICKDSIPFAVSGNIKEHQHFSLDNCELESLCKYIIERENPVY